MNPTHRPAPGHTTATPTRRSRRPWRAATVVVVPAGLALLATGCFDEEGSGDSPPSPSRTSTTPRSPASPSRTTSTSTSVSTRRCRSRPRSPSTTTSSTAASPPRRRHADDRLRLAGATSTPSQTPPRHPHRPAASTPSRTTATARVVVTGLDGGSVEIVNGDNGDDHRVAARPTRSTSRVDQRRRRRPARLSSPGTSSSTTPTTARSTSRHRHGRGLDLRRRRRRRARQPRLHRRRARRRRRADRRPDADPTTTSHHPTWRSSHVHRSCSGSGAGAPATPSRPWPPGSLLAVAVVAASSQFGGELVDDYKVPGVESQQGTDVLEERLPRVRRRRQPRRVPHRGRPHRRSREPGHRRRRPSPASARSTTSASSPTRSTPRHRR